MHHMFIPFLNLFQLLFIHYIFIRFDPFSWRISLHYILITTIFITFLLRRHPISTSRMWSSQYFTLFLTTCTITLLSINKMIVLYFLHFSILPRILTSNSMIWNSLITFIRLNWCSSIIMFYHSLLLAY